MVLATRVIPVLLFNDRGAVKGKQFKSDRVIGSIRDRLQLLERRDIDELILLDIAATLEGRGPRFEMLADLCSGMFCPVTAGGGIRSHDDIRQLLRCGADKVAINTMAIKAPNTVDDCARRFGSQCITVAIDVSDETVRSHCGRRDTGLDPIEWAGVLEHRGAGEILLTSIDRDGMMCGYDLDLISEVSNAVDIPIIAAGGCGSYQDMQAAIEAGAHAVAVGAFFQFCEATPKEAARYMNGHGIATRI